MSYAQAEDSRVDWEGALVQRAGAGDTRAFERLYREHSGRVYGLCLRITRDAQLAEDCTQETFINAWRALAQFETRSSLSTWLHRIAVNVSLGRRRKATPVEEATGTRTRSVSGGWTLETPVEVEGTRGRHRVRCRTGHAMPWCCMRCMAIAMARPRRCSASPRAPARRSCTARADCCARNWQWR